MSVLFALPSASSTRRDKKPPLALCCSSHCVALLCSLMLLHFYLASNPLFSGLLLAILFLLLLNRNKQQVLLLLSTFLPPQFSIISNNSNSNSNSKNSQNNNNNNTYNMDKSEFIYTPETAILYSLGIGEEEDLRYLYECSDQFSIFPTYSILPSVKALIDFDTHSTTLHKLGIPFDVTRLLHGEQFVEFFKPLPNNQCKLITNKPHMIEVLDKGSGTVVITETNTYTQDGQLLCRNQVCCMIVGTGGWNGPRLTENKLVENIIKPPEREPDQILSQETHQNQAALYRLSGDKNPLHIDPIFAQAGGYSKPILHGLCSLGFAVRHVTKSYPNQVLKRVKARFSGVIYPGETIVTEMWKENTRVHFQCKVKESGKKLILGAYVDFAQ